jgi:hypothetical protein
MSLLYDASLIITPTAYKESKLYALKPQSGLGDMTVTRATTATRVNSDGLVELVPYNLLRYSEQFENASWNKVGGGGGLAPVVTNNAGVAPNGSNTADRVQFNCVGTTIAFRSILGQANIVTSIGAIFTQTLYVKAYSPSEVGKQLRIVSEGTNNGFIITITADWQRIVVNGIPAIFTSSNFNIETRGGFTTNTTADVLLWGAQLVEGSTAKDYFPTTDRLNVPRIDYSNGGCPSILVEPQRTNLLLRSEEFENVYWTKVNASVTANTTTSPSGLLNADLVETTNVNHSIFTNVGVSASTNYAFSFYAKRGTMTDLKYAVYDVTNGNFIISTTSYYSSTSISEWSRIVVPFTTPVGCTSIRVFPIYNSGVTGTFYLWGAQLE